MAAGLYHESIPYITDDEVLRIKSCIPELIRFHKDAIDPLWSDFSITWYCASYLDVTENHIAEFSRYLLTDERC